MKPQWVKVKAANITAYRNEALKLSVVYSNISYCWLISRDSSGIQSGEFATEKEAMKAAERG